MRVGIRVETAEEGVRTTERPMLAFLAASFASPTVEITRTVEIAPGVEMPRVNLGTCCGSEATHSFPAWYAAGGRGVDTALDYGKEAPGGKQTELAAAIAAAGVPRSSVFITTKIRAGFDLAHGGPLCVGVSAEHALSQVRQDVAELNVTHVDLVLLHAPCLTDGANYALWQGLEEAHALNLTRAIGVSNYKAKQLSALIAKADKKPSVNQCLFSVAHHDDETLDYCKANGVQYEVSAARWRGLGWAGERHACADLG